MATIVDVAKHAKVSTATVSAVVNGKEWVSEALKQRIMRAIDIVGYRPNAIARSLKSGRSGTIGMLVSDISNPFFASVFQAVNRIAISSGYSIVLCSSEESADLEQSYVRILRDRMIDGLILAPSAHDEACVELLAQTEMPTVLIDRILPNRKIDAVVVDNYDATKNAISHLLSLGHQRIGFVAGPPDVWTAAERFRGYRDALKEGGISIDDTIVSSGKFSQSGGYEAAITIMSCRQAPTAIFASNNKMMIGVILAINGKGLKCPEDISLASFDDFEWASAFQPALTVVRQPTDLIGEQAASLLISRINGSAKIRTPQILTLSSELVVRGSCRPVVHSANQSRRRKSR